MIKYAKILNEDTKEVSIANSPSNWVISQGYTPLDVEQSEVNNRWYLMGYAPKYTDEERKKEERKRLDSLSLTRADVERAIYKAKGIDFEDILELVKDNPEIDLKALKIELKANNFFRGNPYINQIGALLNLTPQMLDEFFETNDYRALIAQDEDKNA